MGSNARLAGTARAIRLGGPYRHQSGHVDAILGKTLATCVQALFSAIYLDSGKDMTIVKDAMRALGLVD